MRAKTITALCGLIGLLGFGTAFLLTGCASGHKQFLYVVGQGSNEIFAFRAQRDGTLTPLGSPNFPAGSNPVSIAIHTDGSFLYIADFFGDNLTLLDINKGNGNLSTPPSISVVSPVTPPNIFNTGTGPISVAMDPAAPFLYVADQTSGDLVAFTVDPGHGTLTLIPNDSTQPPTPTFPIAPASNPASLAISPKGDFLFTANPVQGTVAIFAISSKGVPSQVGAAVPMGAGSTPTAVIVHPSSRFLYVADSAHNAVLGFAIQSNGALSPISGSPFAAGTAPGGLAIDPQGALLYAANTGSNNVSGFAIDVNSGALGPVTGSPFATGGAGPTSLVVDANSTVLYVTDQASHDVAALGILTTGALKPIAGSPFSVPTAATSVALVQR